MKESAGLLVHHREGGVLRVLLVHPGGPWWARKDRGAWSIPKGELGPDAEDPLTTARREFAEELGQPPPEGPAQPLGTVTQRGGKRVTAWAVAGRVDVSEIVSNLVEVEWPPRSGRRLAVPEIDRAEWFPLGEARERINPAQVAFLDRLADQVQR